MIGTGVPGFCLKLAIFLVTAGRRFLMHFRGFHLAPKAVFRYFCKQFFNFFNLNLGTFFLPDCVTQAGVLVSCFLVLSINGPLAQLVRAPDS